MDSDLSSYPQFIRGSDPRAATCRGKLQSRRCKLNQEINKELRLRAGAENLYKATTNRKLRDTVALELSFVNSNLQLLKEQLAELNSSVEIYQNDSQQVAVPMIPLGLKETKEVDFREPFTDFILEHYSEDASIYQDAIADLMDTRQAIRTPARDSSGAALLFRYYNILYFVERRFFPPDRSLGVYFEWYDSLTGVPSCQRTVAFEKACVLFNLGAVYTQIGAKQERNSSRGLDSAVDSFLRAAGVFRYILDTFTNAPSMDLRPQVLDTLVQMMLAQARECLYEKLSLQSRSLLNGEETDREDEDALSLRGDLERDLAGEAGQVARDYGDLHAAVAADAVAEFVPASWTALIGVKREYYTALSHQHSAASILGPESACTSSVPQDRIALGAAHLREAIACHEEAQRLQRMSRELKGKTVLTRVLRMAHSEAAATAAAVREETGAFAELAEILETPSLEASSKFQLTVTEPDLAAHRVEDPFRSLGPIAIFSARRYWTAPRVVRLQRHKEPRGDGFGFSVRGDAPVIVSHVDSHSLADLGGVKEGDFVVGIGNKDVKWSPHQEVVQLIQNASASLTLRLVTPMDRNYLKPSSCSTIAHGNFPNGGNKGSVSTYSSSSGVSSGGPSPPGSLAQAQTRHRKLPWNPFRR
uniref:Putative signal transduction protein n=1 Tax=Xenopsylla cheopis TaxID=163159 RepID=A0A6M2DHN6_XENCH